MIDFSGVVVSIDDLLSSVARVILFGAGGAGRDAISQLKRKNIEVMFLCDNDLSKCGSSIDGIEICNPSKLVDYLDEVVLITSDYAKEIGLQLQNLGVIKFYYFGYCHDYERWHDHFNPEVILGARHEIEQVRSLFIDDISRTMFERLIAFRMTFDPTLLMVSDCEDYWHPSVHPLPGDGIIDAGAWVGDTATFFAHHLGGDCRIWSFEPDDNNYQIMLDNILKYDLRSVINPIKLGLWSANTYLNFNESVQKTDQFRIDEMGGGRIEVVRLDDFVTVRSISVDLLKMDIEGAEYEALIGSKHIIEKFAPKLQICIYHKPDDLWRIPLLIRELNPDYKFFLGVHKQHFIDTVLYATTQG